MLKKLFKHFIAKHGAKEQKQTELDIKNSNKILFAVFSRYGDGIISFRIISEFISKNPDKKYTLLTTAQLLPYAQKLIAEKNIKILAVNKRNPVSLLSTIMKLKKLAPDIGFNPWSHGDDAEFFISFAKHFCSYKKFSKHPKEYNVYDRVREYLGLETKADKKVNGEFDWQSSTNVVIAPISTDPKKNLSESEVKKIISKFTTNQTKITVAIPKGAMSIAGVDMFYFAKSGSRSKEFIDLLDGADLFIGVDSGPLHLALCMGKQSLGFFGSNAPETILDSGFELISFRDKALLGVFCFVKECENPECIHNMFEDDFLNHRTEYSKNMGLKTDKCALEGK